jgi:hypothetical protein
MPAADLSEVTCLRRGNRPEQDHLMCFSGTKDATERTDARHEMGTP